jgi:hypothetical protein
MKHFYSIPPPLFPLLLVLASLLILAPAHAQSPLVQVISSGGGYFTGSNGSLSFTIGETVVQPYSGTTAMLTQGFQQTIVTSNPLPLDFLSFTATLADGRTQLQWVTVREVNTGHFDVERSTDGTVFSRLLTVQSVDNPATINTYHAVDSFPLAGSDYYRVKEVDLDGSVSYSPTAVVTLNPALTCMIYPNPASSQVFIHIQSDGAKPVAINWYDLRGRLVLSRQIQLTTGPNQADFNIESLAKGVYIVKIAGLDDLPSFKIIKR